MLDYCRMRTVQAVEMVERGSWKSLLKEIFYLDRVAVPVEIELASLRPEEDFPRPPGEQVLEVTRELLEKRRASFPVRSRYLKALEYLAGGYRGYALLQGNAVAGDIWCADAPGKYGAKHPDETWLGLKCGDREVYTFDMFMDPHRRGGNAAAALQNGALHALRKEGYTKAYGFFWSDNVPALWVHRTLRWRELARVKASRFLLSRKLRVRPAA